MFGLYLIIMYDQIRGQRKAAHEKQATYGRSREVYGRQGRKAETHGRLSRLHYMFNSGTFC